MHKMSSHWNEPSAWFFCLIRSLNSGSTIIGLASHQNPFSNLISTGFGTIQSGSSSMTTTATTAMTTRMTTTTKMTTTTATAATAATTATMTTTTRAMKVQAMTTTKTMTTYNINSSSKFYDSSNDFQLWVLWRRQYPLWLLLDNKQQTMIAMTMTTTKTTRQHQRRKW